MPESLTETMSKSKPFRGQMCPRNRALLHPAAHLLLEYARTGCPVDCGRPWTTEEIQHQISKGAHPSAKTPEAAKALRAETLDKIQQGFARLVDWDKIKHNHPEQLKVSPVAAIPHKSRLYRMILDLSHALRLMKTPSVNDSTVPLAPPEAMAQLGHTLPRIIHRLATAHPSQPVNFVKFDIKDGFWRMVVAKGAEWNFAYVLPKTSPEQPTQLVIPDALQMGWTESPPFFCAASETGRDIADQLLCQDPNLLPPHPLENLSLPHEPTSSEVQRFNANFLCHLECYVDDYICLLQSSDPKILRGAARSILTAIHDIFPPTHVTKFQGEDPISIQKILKGEGVWSTSKEILGWMFDGITRCIAMPPDKHAKLQAEIRVVQRAARRRCPIPQKQLEKLRGKLNHASQGIPAGKPLISPLTRAIDPTKPKRLIYISTSITNALRDFRAILRQTVKAPILCRRLITGAPSYIGYSDASLLGCGGVWLSGIEAIKPLVWRYEWPPSITHIIKTPSNPSGTITINELETAGVILAWLVVEQYCPVENHHIALWCDNTPTVSWTRKMSSSKSIIGAQLIRALAIRQAATRASPLIAASIRGIDNGMADVASRSFGKRATAAHFGIDNFTFLTNFSSAFPLPQGLSWHLFTPANKLTSLVCSALASTPLIPASWERITVKGASIGTIGHPGATALTWTPVSSTNRQHTSRSHYAALLHGSGEATTAGDALSKLRPFKSRFEPSERPSSWLPSQTHAMHPPTATSHTSDDSSKATAVKTPHHNPN